MLKRPSKKTVNIIIDIKKYLNKSEKEGLILEKNPKYSQLDFKFDYDNYYNDYYFDENDLTEDDGYIDIFENDKHFHVGEDGWVALANENENSRSNIKHILQHIRKIM